MNKEFNLCETCSYRGEPFKHASRLHICTCPKLTSDTYGDKNWGKDDSLVYQYDEGGSFFVGDKFGCVHWLRIDKP